MTSEKPSCLVSIVKNFQGGSWSGTPYFTLQKGGCPMFLHGFLDSISVFLGFQVFFSHPTNMQFLPSSVVYLKWYLWKSLRNHWQYSCFLLDDPDKKPYLQNGKQKPINNAGWTFPGGFFQLFEQYFSMENFTNLTATLATYFSYYCSWKEILHPPGLDKTPVNDGWTSSYEVNI